jgi:hypothetical protein
MWVEPQLVAPALHEALAGFGDDHPWERAVTMLALAQTTGELGEALAWGRNGVALFHSVGDDMYAANSLFIMAERAIEAGIGDDEVHRWLTESRALAETSGSEVNRVHASVGFGTLAWLRGDHDSAARLMEEALPTLRRLGDQRCTGRALCVLGQRAYEENQLDRAERLLTGSVEAIALAGHSVVLARALEALATVHAAGGRQRAAALLLGTAHAARTSAARTRPVRHPDEHLRPSLVKDLGAATFDAAYTKGQTLTPSQALESVRSPAR